MTYLCGMKNILRHIRRWWYRREFKRLFFLYATRNTTAEAAAKNAAVAFEWLYAFEYAELFKKVKAPDV